MNETVKKSKWNILNKIMNHSEQNNTLKFMNYGYKHLSEDDKLNLLYDDEKNRYYIQLYNHVISKAELYYKDILEVSSGKGGGASYINRYYTPKTYTGMEVTNNLVNFCNSYYNEPGLAFVKGNIDHLPFDKDSFDIVINIGSSRFYNNLPAFFNEVYRVLRKDSCFLFADIIEKNLLETVKHQLRMAGFTIEYKTNITGNIIATFNDEQNSQDKSFKERIPGFMKKAFSPFIHTNDSETQESLVQGRSVYISFVLKKIS
jgi:ubiquinone/menaquinone biosynthesis C-methylase UbiE